MLGEQHLSTALVVHRLSPKEQSSSWNGYVEGMVLKGHKVELLEQVWLRQGGKIRIITGP